MNISVVIPNYNGVHLFPLTFPSLFVALGQSGLEFEVIIIDDCSTDGSEKYIKDNFPQITLLSNVQNSGFSKTINKGIFAAKNDLILLLNSDVRLNPDYFKNQLRYFGLPDTFGVMGQIIGWDDDVIQDGAKYPKFDGFKLKTSYNYIADGSVDSFIYSMYLSGANALINREKLTQLGGFNEIYSPFYMEDVDLSIRAWRVGWKCFFEPLSICRHRTSSSIATKEKKRFVKVIYNRNKMYFHAIHLNGLFLWGWYTQTFFELLFRLLCLQFEYIDSGRIFLNTAHRLAVSKNQIIQLSSKTGVGLSLREVAGIIKKSNSNHVIKIFKR